jgi:adenosyl cobinamide kinase/adenosyl cobinamide phosphate guanylyltransferase
LTGCTLVLGGTRSGKSAVAERLAATAAEISGAPVIYMATATITDDNMSARVQLHRARRPPSWSTVEVDGAPELPTLLATLRGVVLLDSLGAWMARHLDFVADTDGLCAALRDRDAPTIVVSEEVGLAVHPPTSVGRQFVDALGTLNQAVAAVAERVVLVVAGRILEL